MNLVASPIHPGSTVHRFLCIALLLLANMTLFAAETRPKHPEAPGAGKAAKPPPSEAPAQEANQPPPEAPPPANAPPLVRLQFPNSDIVDVLHLYEQLTGKKLVMDNFVQGKVNIFIAKDVSREEAIKIIEMSMALNGISLVPAGRDIMDVVGAGQNPRKAPVPIVSDLADIPAGNPVVSFLFRLQYADPQELQQVLMAYFQGSSGTINILALPKSSSLLVTQNADIIRQLAGVIEQVDVAPAEVVSEFIKLERADATKVVDMLNEVFEKGGQPTGQPGQGGVRGVKLPAPVPQPMSVEAGGGGLLSEEAVIVGKIKLTPDVRTNRIHVVTRPINMPFIRQLIHEFDANVEFAKPVTRPLRYISAGDVLPVLVQSLTEPGTEGAGAGAGGGAAIPGAPQQPGQDQRRANSTVTSPYVGGQSATATGSSLNISEELSTQPVDTVPKAVVIGNSKLIADQRSNSIIIIGNREVVVKVEKILDEMDIKAPQVALSTVIGQLSLNNNEEFGVDWFAKYQNKLVAISRNNTIFGSNNPLIPVPQPATSPGTGTGGVGPGIIDPSNLINFSQIIQNVANGTNIYVAAGNYLAAIVHLLEATGRFRVVSRPTVFTSNNKKAIIASGQEVPVPVNTLSNVGTIGINGTAAVQASIEYKKVALQLEVVPLINSEKEVSLDILQKIDNIVQGGNVIISGNSVPTIATRYIRTNVSAANGSTIVLGGLVEDTKQKNYQGLPYLSRIPVVGSLFRATATGKQRTELIVLMCPQVTLTKLDAYRLRQKWEDTTHFGPELDQGECQDCPKVETGKQISLPPPDLPAGKDM